MTEMPVHSPQPSINIIYVGGTVARLLPFLDSIIEHTAWQLCLVSNGCTAFEREQLESVAASHHTRVEHHVASVDRVLSHGEVLTLLLEREASPYFCILDSDIFAAGPVSLESLLPEDDQVAVCSCVPIWHRDDDLAMPDGFEIAGGRFLRTARSDFLGCSYAASYRADVLRSTLDRWGVSLEKYDWKELPANVRSELRRRGLKMRTYDTTKVANILIQTRERPMEYTDNPNLIHLGGQSSGTTSFGIARPTFSRRVRWMSSNRLPWLIAGSWWIRGLSAAESASLSDLAHRRFEAERFLACVADGTASLDDAPEWLRDADKFAAVQSILQSTRSTQIPN